MIDRAASHVSIDREQLASELYYHHNPKKGGFNWDKENPAEKKMFYELADIVLKYFNVSKK